MPLSGTQETDLAAALASNGVDGSVAAVLAALDEADLVAADKDTGVKIDYDPAVTATATGVVGQPGVQIITCVVGGATVAWMKWRDPAVPNSRAVVMPLAVLATA